MERNGARSNRRQQIVGVLSGQKHDQVRRRFLKGLEQRVGGLFVGAIDVIDEKDAPVAVQRIEPGLVLELTHLLDGDLAKRTVGREGYEIGVGGKQKRIVIALFGGPFLAVGDGGQVGWQAEIVLLNAVGAAQQCGGEPASERGLADPLRTVEENGLRDALLLRESEQRRRRLAIAEEVGEHGFSSSRIAGRGPG